MQPKQVSSAGGGGGSQVGECAPGHSTASDPGSGPGFGDSEMSVVPCTPGSSLVTF